MSIKEVLNVTCVLSGILCFSSCANRTAIQEKRQYNEELAVFERAQHYIDEEAYDNAYKLYSYFLKQYPQHPLADDAAYRLCYIYIIDCDKNSYLNYPHQNLRKKEVSLDF